MQRWAEGDGTPCQHTNTLHRAMRADGARVAHSLDRVHRLVHLERLGQSNSSLVPDVFGTQSGGNQRSSQWWCPEERGRGKRYTMSARQHSARCTGRWERAEQGWCTHPIVCTVWFTLSASARATAPSGPMLLPRKLEENEVHTSGSGRGTGEGRGQRRSACKHTLRLSLRDDVERTCKSCVFMTTHLTSFSAPSSSISFFTRAPCSVGNELHCIGGIVVQLVCDRVPPAEWGGVAVVPCM
jgi:hypothetical protein